MCVCDDFDPPAFLAERHRRARKRHRCSECSRYILRGEDYLEITGCWDGSVSTFRWCRHCDAARRRLSALGIGCDCWVLGSLWEDLPERARWERPKREFARILAGVLRMWTRRRGRLAGELMDVPEWEGVERLPEPEPSMARAMVEF